MFSLNSMTLILEFKLFLRLFICCPHQSFVCYIHKAGVDCQLCKLYNCLGIRRQHFIYMYWIIFDWLPQWCLALLLRGSKSYLAYRLKHSKELWLSLITQVQVHMNSTYTKSVFINKVSKTAHLQSGVPVDISLASEAGQKSLLTSLSWVLCKEGSPTFFRALTYLG